MAVVDRRSVRVPASQVSTLFALPRLEVLCLLPLFSQGRVAGIMYQVGNSSQICQTSDFLSLASCKQRLIASNTKTLTEQACPL